METEYYILATDLDARSSTQYLGYFDKMYEEMSVAFGVPVGRNVWCGKCVDFAFSTQDGFVRFEDEIINNTFGDLRAKGGVCHAQSSGRVVISVWKGDGEDSFAHKLVHETSHGFVARYLSDAPVPSWLNEGMAEWMAQYIVKTPGLLTKNRNERRLRLNRAATSTGCLR